MVSRRHDHFPAEASQAVEDEVASIVETIQWSLRHHELNDGEDLRALIDGHAFDETVVGDLDVDDQLTVLELEGDTWGSELTCTAISGLRQVLEQQSASILHAQAQAAVSEMMDELESFLEENDFEIADLEVENRFGWARHDGERDINDACTVHEYRYVEGEIHVDVWAYRLTDDVTLYLYRWPEQHEE